MAYPATTPNEWPGVSDNNDNYVSLFKQAYSDVIRLKAQEMDSRLSDTCLYEELRGDPLNLDAWKNVAVTTRSRGQIYGAASNDKQYSETLTERRTLTPAFYEFAELFDPRDEPALLRSIRPDSNYLANIIAAFNRQKDATIAAALSGSVGIVGATANTATFEEDIALAQGATQAGVEATGFETAPAGSIGATSGFTGDNRFFQANTVQTDGAASELSVDDLVKGRQILEAQGAINPGDPVYVAMNPSVARYLLADTALTSYDFNAIRPLVSGEIANFLGCEFRMSTEIPIGLTPNMAGSSTNTVDTTAADAGSYVYMYARSAMTFGMAQDMQIRFDELPQRGYSLQVFHSLGLGAVRMDPKKIVRIGTVS